MYGNCLRRLLFATFLGMCCSQSVFALENSATDLYGRGVHAFFGRDYQNAQTHLTAAIKQQNQDPRCYYFRGLVLDKLGKDKEATADFKRAAILEFSGEGPVYNIGKALQRVQGSVRLKIEGYRSAARREVRQKEKTERNKRYRQLKFTIPIPSTPPAESDPSDPFLGTGETVIGAGIADLIQKSIADRKARPQTPISAETITESTINLDAPFERTPPRQPTKSIGATDVVQSIVKSLGIALSRDRNDNRDPFSEDAVEAVQPVFPNFPQNVIPAEIPAVDGRIEIDPSSIEIDPSSIEQEFDPSEIEAELEKAEPE